MPYPHNDNNLVKPYEWMISEQLTVSVMDNKKVVSRHVMCLKNWQYVGYRDKIIMYAFFTLFIYNLPISCHVRSIFYETPFLM